MSEQSTKKIEAIYALRKAAEQKGKAELVVDEEPSAEARDALLDAQLTLEDSTVEAIKACHECGREHGPSEPHYKAND
ncbi:MAG TPA: hypothetical protein VKT51_10130 [Candidatus Eremiobacteraceae bacterium]|nr:hypothetical protein [Candidatus Eremiobacteraceae bacterium]